MTLLLGIQDLLVRPQYTASWWASAVAILLALTLLDSLDIRLPRGDSIGVGGSLCAAALFLLGVHVAVPLCIVTPFFGYFAHGHRQGLSLKKTLLVRSVALAFSAGCFALLARVHSFWPIPALVVPIVFLLAELGTAQLSSARGDLHEYFRLLWASLREQAPILAAEWSAALLLLLIYKGMGPWSLILVVALLLLIRQSYSLLLNVRETYRATIEVLVEAAEAQDEWRVGHAERSATIARKIGAHLGLSGSQLELVSYASLLHDIGAIGDDAGSLSTHNTKSTVVVREVDFLTNVMPVLEICEGTSSDSTTENHQLIAMIVAVASDADMIEVGLIQFATATSAVKPHVTPTLGSRVLRAASALSYATVDS
ncbi:MAG: HD domain-containing protein [Coriobacteriia bacterium]